MQTTLRDLGRWLGRFGLLLIFTVAIPLSLLGWVIGFPNQRLAEWAKDRWDDLAD